MKFDVERTDGFTEKIEAAHYSTEGHWLVFYEEQGGKTVEKMRIRDASVISVRRVPDGEEKEEETPSSDFAKSVYDAQRRVKSTLVGIFDDILSHVDGEIEKRLA